MSGIGRRALGLRALGVALGGSTLGGCGFRPLYGAQGGAGSPSTLLAGIYVPVMPERSGQLMRQALQQRVEGSSTGVQKRYELTALFSVVGEGVAIQRDNSTTRVRLVGVANWTLRDLTPNRAIMTAGIARTVDGYNILNQQFFAADLESDVVQRRIAEALADQIVMQVASWVRKQGNATG
jgi:LPS-assembly lipoprotein